jgi:outer membrane protein OmpA-like peptidoglycan-associated protein
VEGPGTGWPGKKEGIMAVSTAVNLIELVKGYLGPDVVQHAASYVGESPAATQKALTSIVPTVIAGLANMASTTSGAQELSRMLDSGGYDGRALDGVASMLSGGAATKSAAAAGGSILDTLFGSKLGGIADALARVAGIRGGSAHSLLALVAPIVMHVLGRQRSALGGTSALIGLLAEQKGALAGLLPAGLGSLLGLPGLSDLGSTVASAASPITREVPVSPRSTARTGWLIPLVVIGALALALLAWLTTWRTEPVREATRRITDVQLPGGFKMSVPEGSFNVAVARYLASPRDSTVPKRFVFEDLTFETGSTKLTPGSATTVDGLVTILKAYPTVSVALEGHTDSTGDPAANKQLSRDRATAVKEIIVKGGVQEARISTAGYGSERPIAPNDTEAGRAKNRRLELVVEKR